MLEPRERGSPELPLKVDLEKGKEWDLKLRSHSCGPLGRSAKQSRGGKGAHPARAADEVYRSWQSRLRGAVRTLPSPWLARPSFSVCHGWHF